MTDIMRSIDLKSKEVLEILDKCKDIWQDDFTHFKKHFPLRCSDDKREDYITDEYLNKIMNMGSSHDGYPMSIKCHSFRDVPDKNPEILPYFKKKIDLSTELGSVLGSKHNALFAVYPPGGYISWHNNSNASSYNVILTWSETGDGYWKHVDPYTKKQVVVQDKPGWQAKGFYFGSYEDDPNKLVYHMASTDCWRMTVSFVWDRYNKQFWEDCIDELETE